MDSKIIHRQLQAARESWIDLAPGKRLKLRRPAENDMPRYFEWVGIDLVAESLVDWEGFTEADLLGAAVGSADAVPFDAALAREVLADRADWTVTAANALVKAISDHLERRSVEKKD